MHLPLKHLTSNLQLLTAYLFKPKLFEHAVAGDAQRWQRSGVDWGGECEIRREAVKLVDRQRLRNPATSGMGCQQI